VADQQISAAIRRNAPDPVRRVPSWLAFGLVPAVIVAGAVLLISIASTPPRFVARAIFEVDWKSMPSVPNDPQAEESRDKWRKQIISKVTSLPQSKQKISDLLDRVDGFNGSQTDRAAVISKFQRWLRFKLANQTADSDRFIVEMRDADPDSAKAEANWATHGIVAGLRTESRFGSGLAALRSYSNVDDIIEKEDALREEQRKLDYTYSPPFPDDVQERYEQIESELNKLEQEHMEAGFGLLFNFRDALSNDSIKLVDEAHVEQGGAGYWLGVLFAAALLGCAAGVAGLLTRRVVTGIMRPKAASTGAPPVIAPARPEIGAPPVISQCQVPRLQVLPPPLPPVAYR